MRRANLRPPPPPSDLFSENFVNVPAVSDVMDFNRTRVLIDPINNPVALGTMRKISRHVALETFPGVGFLRQQFDCPFHKGFQRRGQPENLTAANGRIYEPIGTCHGSAQASSWVMTLPALNSRDDRARALTTL